MKTHWLKNPNKNYLGHWDIPETGDLTLTIKNAGWEEVKDPTTGKKQNKRVVHFVENYKPLICNQTNAKSIVIATGCAFIEDSIGKSITAYRTKVFDRKNKIEVDAVRIRNEEPKKHKKQKPELLPNTDKWVAGVAFLAKEGNTMVKLKAAYSISAGNEQRIKTEAMGKL